ncbi:hypothetical protein L249_5964 [Ophiocordyceps polyrhachis-furcata BCC 54312]|uniref:Uncharacterized protein n=1 Tax=Ophiocordyceps polyrhachis-furcata BCC 54312 TaxID=1330021 RepID=A0A367LIF2_9HYPO|nr:hypothetical protein L249_5964 [Ophiocordyceps polyrhachis-furcata BCC 54312]
MAPSAAPLDRAPGNTVGRPIDSLQRSLQRSARCTYSGYSTRLISAQGSRYSDRRAVPIAVIALDQSSQRDRHSDRRAVLIAVIAPDLDGRTKVRSTFRSTFVIEKFVYKGRRFSHLLPVHYQLQLHYFFNTITSPAFNSSLILTKPPSRYEPGFSHLIRDTNKLSTNFLPPSSSSTAPQNTLFDSTFPTLGLEQT